MKYAYSYESKSKGRIQIEDMPSPHIANAWRKLGGTSLGSENLGLRDAMFCELVERGCTYDAETGQWKFPPKPEVAS